MRDVIRVLLLPLAVIPDGATVSMRTGEKLYLINRHVRFFPATPDRPNIKAGEGVVFLMSGGDVNIHPEAKEVLWHVLPEELSVWLEGTPQ